MTDGSGKALIVDPGCHNYEERQVLTELFERNELQLEAILNTHCHIDHIFGNAYLKREFKVPLWIPDNEQDNMQRSIDLAEAWGLPFDESPQPDTWLKTEGEISFGQSSLKILYTPGHSAGHLSFYYEEGKQLFSGDVLFQGSIGRTDLPGGDFNTLMESIRTQLLPLPDDVTVYSGHGPETTIGEERRTNPFILQYVQG